MIAKTIIKIMAKIGISMPSSIIEQPQPINEPLSCARLWIGDRWPHCGQDLAALLIFAPHILHLIKPIDRMSLPEPSWNIKS